MTTDDRIRLLNKQLGTPMSIYAKEAAMRKMNRFVNTPLWEGAQTARA